MKKIQKNTVNTLAALLVLALAGCGTVGKKDNDLADSILTSPLKVDLPPTAGQGSQRCGNEPSYTINGRSYRVLPSAQGYRQEGMASWYGAEYQGSTTAGCETFDMHAFTAAHRSLPLPSFVRVTNLANNKSVIVRVNDRGPFENNGLIQLSFAAASTLGMTGGSRNARVRVEAVASGDSGTVKKSVRGVSGAKRQAAPRAIQRPGSAPIQAAAVKRAKQSGKSFYVVVKNYQDQAGALDMFVRLTSVGLSKTEMASAVNKGRKMHQVRVGPLYTQDQIDSVKDTLASNGLATFKVVEVDQ